MFGFDLFPALFLTYAMKNFLFEFGPRYAAATGTSLLDGFYTLFPKWVFYIFLVLEFADMFLTIASIAFVGADLLNHFATLTGKLEPWIMSAIAQVLSGLLLHFGQFAALDGVTKIIIALLTVCTLSAVVAALASPPERIAETPSFEFTNSSHVGFLMAFSGWNPTGPVMSVWFSLWQLEAIKIRSQSKRADHNTPANPHDEEDEEEEPDDYQAGFHIGYWGAFVVAVCFLTMGSQMLSGDPANSSKLMNIDGTTFTELLVDMYVSPLLQLDVALCPVAPRIP